MASFSFRDIFYSYYGKGVSNMEFDDLDIESIETRELTPEEAKELGLN